MSFDAGSIHASLILDRSPFASGLAAATTEATTGSQKIASAMKVGMVGAAAGMGLALAGMAKVGIEELANAQKVTAQTEAVLRSTGGAANVTRGHILELAGAIQQKSGIDAEAVQEGQNMLLTFKNIRNEAGAGNDIFDQATHIMADMSVALGKDMPASALMLGKALNDPIAGVTALGRAGVQFTDQQKAQIESMVEAGNVMGAQKLILAELTSQFGGSAKALGGTLTGQWNILKESLIDTAATIMQAAMPALMLLTKGLVFVVTQFSRLPGWMQASIVVLGALGVMLPGVVIALGWLATSMMTLTGTATVGAAALAIYKTAVATLALPFARVIPILYAFGAALWASLGPIALVVAAVALLAAGAYLIYRNWGGIKAFFVNLWRGIPGTAQGLLNWFRNLPISLRNVLMAGLRAIPIIGPIIGAIGSLLGWLEANRGNYGTAARNLVISIAQGILTGLRNAPIVKPIVDAFIWLIGAVKSVLGIASGSKVFNWIGQMIVWGAIEGIYAMAQRLWDAVKSVIGGAVEWAKNLLGIHSRSTVGFFIGRMLDLGVEQGIDAGRQGVQRAAGRMAGAATVGAIRVPGVSVGSSAVARRGPRRRKQRPIVLQLEIAGEKFEQVVSGATYEQLRKEIIGMEGF